MSTIDDPYGSGTYVAVPATELDAAICHLNVSDERGNAAFLGPDLYFDDLFLRAAPKGKRFLSVERTVPTKDPRERRRHRAAAEGEPPHGRWTRRTTRRRTLHQLRARLRARRGFQKEYATAAKSAEAWAAFCAAWLDITEDEYQAKVASRLIELGAPTRAEVCCVCDRRVLPR